MCKNSRITRVNKVYLVGAGPGKADLITVRGLNILKEADVIIYDYLVDRGLLDYAGRHTELICCDRLGKDRYSNGFASHQEGIDELIIERVQQGKRVVRLKNGDPSIFSRCSQELKALRKKGIKFEIVPGITAASAAACFSGIPLTDRELASSCVLVTGHEASAKTKSLIDWRNLAKGSTIVFYMAVDNLDSIAKRLLESEKHSHTPCAVVQDATLLTQQVVVGPLKDIARMAKDAGVKPPAVVIVGEVVRFQKEFNWLKEDKKILFTGLSRERFFTDDRYFHLPLIKIEPIEDYTGFDNYLKDIKIFDWIVFTSRYGVKYFFERLKKLQMDIRCLGDIKIASIGNSTARALIDSGIIPHLVPEEESSKGLIREFRKVNIKQKKIFLPRSNISDKGLEDAFRRLGAKVTASFAYKNVMPEYLPDLDLGKFDEIMFTSPSTVRNFKKRYGRIPGKVKITCIGDATLREAKRCMLLD